MTECYHICFTSHYEVLFRSESDYVYGVFSMVLAAVRSNTSILAFALMSDHVHLVVMTEVPTAFISAFRNSYTQHFNVKYKRKGRLGDINDFILKLTGTNHILAATSYVLRNPVHHGVSKSPFEYDYSSAASYFNDYFFRKRNPPQCIMSRRELSKKCLINRNSVQTLPENYEFDSRGMLIFESFLNVSFVENQFVSGRRFSYYMTRFSGEEWAREQMRDQIQNPPVKLESIEPFSNLSDLLLKERCSFKPRRIYDQDVCELIDNRFTGLIGVGSYCMLGMSDRRGIANILMNQYFASKRQVCRCLAIHEGDLSL